MPKQTAAAATRIDESRGTPIHPALGQHLQETRVKAGMSQAAVAHAMGRKTPEWLGMIEKGHRPLELKYVPKLADILGVNRKDLIKLVIRSYWPIVYASLWPKETIQPFDKQKDSIRQANGESSQFVATAAMEVWEKIEDLPKANRVSVLNIIDQMYEASRTARQRTS